MIRAMIFLFISFSALALENPYNWEKIELDANNPLRQTWLSKSIADSIFRSLDRADGSIIPPIEHVGAVASGSFASQSQILINQILNNLQVDMKSKFTRNRRPGSQRFVTGVRNELIGRLVEYQYRAKNGSDYITCIAVVEDHKKVHAIYLTSYLSSLPKCTSELENLASSTVLYQ